MHRIASLPGDEAQEEITLVEQPPAPIIFLSSATSDISTLASVLELEENKKFIGNVRALPISSISSNAQIDHYIYKTCEKANIIIVRFLGSRAHWSYGFEQLKLLQESHHNTKLIVLSGTSEFSFELNEISNIDMKLVQYLEQLLNQGGKENFTSFISIIDKLLENQYIDLKKHPIRFYRNIILWEQHNSSKTKVAVIFYSSLLKSADTDYASCISDSLKSKDLSPLIIWVNTLRDKENQRKIISLLNKQDIKLVITTTSFSSGTVNDYEIENSLWDALNIPVVQLLTSIRSKRNWLKSSIGMSPIDLSLQVVLPEIDGRIITIPCAFKETRIADNKLCTVIHRLIPDKQNIDWVSSYVQNHLKLQYHKKSELRVCLILANYPIKNGRIANGVGLDTPQSVIQILTWLKKLGYYCGREPLPKTGNQLISLLLEGRTNSPDSHNKEPLDYLSHKEYNRFWQTIEQSSAEKVVNRWEEPEFSIEKEKKGYAITGLRFGNIAVLIQPSRGYDPFNIVDLHSPDLPPPHRYIAQYCWIRNVFKANSLIHVGKHGSIEWLPGKGIGLSNSCFPHILIPPVPNIYPFIVNDPGEGSQAKRRTNAIIIDHLTPPLSTSGLYNNLTKIEYLLDEYYEAKLLSDPRKDLLVKKLTKLILEESLSKDHDLENSFDETIDNIDSYLCEIKESQIKTGLHIFGKQPDYLDLVEMILSLAKVPSFNYYGLTQELSKQIGFKIDPWADDEGATLETLDSNLLFSLTKKKARKKSDVIKYLDSQAKLIIEHYLINSFGLPTKIKKQKLHHSLFPLLDANNNIPVIIHLVENIIPRLLSSSKKEKISLLKALNGERVSSGPSGAPTRGKLEVLPTGRNFYSIDIRGIPTETSWDLAKRSVSILLEKFLLENGEDLTHLAISIWGTSTMRNGGEDICQVFALMGIQPVWEGKSRRIIDLEILPLTVLNRPRVDVTIRISGLFRDAFPQLVDLMHKAQQMIGSLDEDKELNPLAATVSKGGQIGRIYGSAPGSYGAGLQEPINSGVWDEQSDLANSFLEWSKWLYRGSNNIQQNKKGLEECLSKIQVVLHSQDNKEHDILDSDDYYQFQGGLVSSIKMISGFSPQAWIADNSRFSRPRVHKLEKEIDKVVRSRLLNPKWIEGMKKHGYKGAFEMSASLDYLFAYDATTNLVPNWCYKQILSEWLIDKNTKEFIKDNNPWVLKDIAERLLEAINRSMWNNANKEDIKLIKDIIHESDYLVEKYGDKFKIISN